MAKGSCENDADTKRLHVLNELSHQFFMYTSSSCHLGWPYYAHYFSPRIGFSPQRCGLFFVLLCLSAALLLPYCCLIVALALPKYHLKESRPLVQESPNAAHLIPRILHTSTFHPYAIDALVAFVI